MRLSPSNIAASQGQPMSAEVEGDNVSRKQARKEMKENEEDGEEEKETHMGDYENIKI